MFRNSKKSAEKVCSLEQEIEKNEQSIVEIKVYLCNIKYTNTKFIQWIQNELTSLETEAKQIVAEQEGIAVSLYRTLICYWLWL